MQLSFFLEFLFITTFLEQVVYDISMLCYENDFIQIIWISLLTSTRIYNINEYKKYCTSECGKKALTPDQYLTKD